jgi:hypothetical protein
MNLFPSYIVKLFIGQRALVTLSMRTFFLMKLMSNFIHGFRFLSPTCRLVNSLKGLLPLEPN